MLRTTKQKKGSGQRRWAGLALADLVLQPKHGTLYSSRYMPQEAASEQALTFGRRVRLESMPEMLIKGEGMASL